MAVVGRLFVDLAQATQKEVIERLEIVGTNPTTTQDMRVPFASFVEAVKATGKITEDDLKALIKAEAMKHAFPTGTPLYTHLADDPRVTANPTYWTDITADFKDAYFKIGGKLGEISPSSLPNVEGEIRGSLWEGSGSHQLTGQAEQKIGLGTVYQINSMLIKSSYSNSTYQNGAEVNPKSIGLKIYRATGTKTGRKTTMYRFNEDGLYLDSREVEYDEAGAICGFNLTEIAPPMQRADKVYRFDGQKWVEFDEYIGSEYKTLWSKEDATARRFTGFMNYDHKLTDLEPKGLKFPMWVEAKSSLGGKWIEEPKQLATYKEQQAFEAFKEAKKQALRDNEEAKLMAEFKASLK